MAKTAFLPLGAGAPSGSSDTGGEQRLVFADAICDFVKLVIHKNHAGARNTYNQVKKWAEYTSRQTERQGPARCPLISNQ